MMYLLDTSVVSEMRKASLGQTGPVRIDPHVRAWFGSVSAADLYLSVITVLELELGFLLLERRDPAQSGVLRSWVRNRLLPSFAGRILSIDLTVAQRCAALHVPDPLEDRDALIAATALVHGMTVATRNVAHFQRTGVAIANPWQA